MNFNDIDKLKKDLNLYSEDLHSSYLFYTMTCDKLVETIENLLCENLQLKNKLEVTKKTLKKRNKKFKTNEMMIDSSTLLWEYLGIEE